MADKQPQFTGFGDVAPLDHLGAVAYDIKDLMNKPFVITDYGFEESTVNQGTYVKFGGYFILDNQQFECSCSHKLIKTAFSMLKPEHLPVVAQVYQKGKSYYMGNPK